MKTTYITNVILLIIISGLYLFINYEPSLDTNNHNQGISLLKPNDVDTITIQRYNRHDIVLNKTANHWRIISPIQAEANTTRVKLVLSLLTSTPHNQLAVNSDVSLQKFGLEPGSLSVDLNDQSFKFGNIEALNKYRYLQHNTIIYLMDDTIAPLLNSTAASFINNRLITKEQKITQLILPDISLNLENGHWKSNHPTLSTDTLTATIDAWQHAYALQVIPLREDSPVPLGQTISLELDHEITREFLLQLDKRSLSLIDLKQRLKYQFPLAIKQQLIPTEE